MKNVSCFVVGSLVFALGAAGCGDSSHSGPGNSEDLSQLMPAELCAKKCDLQVAANCPNVPPDYASSCALICQAKYDQHPSCVAAARSLDACAIQRVSYGCEGGTISVKPVGACASEGASCASCTGDFLDCL